MAQTAEVDLQLLERLGAGLAIVDPDGRVLRWNDHAARIIGVTADEAIGTPWMDCLTLIRGDSAGSDALRADIQAQGGWHGPLQVRTRDGRIVWLQAHIQSIGLPELDGKPGVAVLFWDGESPDRAASGPPAALLPYRELFVNSSEALFLTDLSSVVVDANAAAAALLRATAGSAHGQASTRVSGRRDGRRLSTRLDRSCWRRARSSAASQSNPLRATRSRPR